MTATGILFCLFVATAYVVFLAAVFGPATAKARAEAVRVEVEKAIASQNQRLIALATVVGRDIGAVKSDITSLQRPGAGTVVTVNYDLIGEHEFLQTEARVGFERVARSCHTSADI